MEQLYKDNLAESDSFNIVLGEVPGAESPEFLETDLEGGDEIASSPDESLYPLPR
jgi:hypothetical protein